MREHSYKAVLCVVQAAIANAQTLAEVQRLETALKTGNVPSEVLVSSNLRCKQFSLAV